MFQCKKKPASTALLPAALSGSNKAGKKANNGSKAADKNQKEPAAPAAAPPAQGAPSSATEFEQTVHFLASSH